MRAAMVSNADTSSLQAVPWDEIGYEDTPVGVSTVFMAPEVVTSPIFQPGASFRFERHRPASVEIVDHD